MTSVEKWGVFEVSLPGKTEGNPFTDYSINAEFSSKNETVTVKGFYDGDGKYLVRFMPSFEEEYSYKVWGTFSDEESSGSFIATAPSKDNHGPVRVYKKFHFAYEDGTPYYSVGTTCYAWAHQPDEVVKDTLDTLAEGYFNKMRFCVFPKHYIHNFKNPMTFPYEGTPVDNSGLSRETFTYMPDFSGNDWDFSRFNPEHFRRIEFCIKELMKLGIEADIIVMHPYDRWGFSAMSAAEDDLYWNYVLARFSAYRNVWWSLANEYDLMRDKTIADWERYAKIICENDPYTHLRSVHNCMVMYDFTRPWITHCSIQRDDIYKCAELTDAYRQRYGKPVVLDEIAYEGNIDQAWGNITGEEMLRRFWESAVRGGYAGHGETFENPEDILWWSHGGKLHGESPARIKFLHKILSETPGLGLKHKEPTPVPGGMFSWDDNVAEPEDSVFAGTYYLDYFGFFRPSGRYLTIPEGMKYRIEVIDTWDMTITDTGVFSGSCHVDLPGKQYMALRFTKV